MSRAQASPGNHLSIFTHAAAGSLATAAELCLVCQESRRWMLPLLYTTVTLTSASSIVTFAYCLMESTARLTNSADSRPPASYVRHLWLGPTSSNAEHDLSYTSSAWPITLIHQILAHTRALRALALINLPQTALYRLEGVIPATVEALTLGPIHGSLHGGWHALRGVRSLTSMDTFLADWDVAALVALPRLRVFTRLFSRPAHIAFAFDQLPCVRRARALQHMRIVCCDETAERAGRVLEELAREHEMCADPRVELVPLSNRVDGVTDGIGVLHRGWIDEGFGIQMDDVSEG
ncbi:hypothetical protein B0H21DRAFT_579311 [Amylocystis lapponica]|nr:hypothetical protein B0H21DRAFT_579311 [Amylocystis lapponica]